MKIKELQSQFAQLPQVEQLAKALDNNNNSRPISLYGLVASSAPMVFAGLALRRPQSTILFILQDAEAAGYFYHDLMQVMGEESVLFFPSSYRRAVKYGQKDPASEILRTDVLSRLSHLSPPTSHLSPLTSHLYIVSFPEAIAEQVVTRRQLDSRTLTLAVGETASMDATLDMLREFGFNEVDYVYEPGQFAQRGSLLDVFSFSHEYPFRIDFFGDDIESIRTFEVDTQLSKESRKRVDIVPELTTVEEKESLLKFLPSDTVLVFRNRQYVREAIAKCYEDGFSSQSIKERLEGATEAERYIIEHEMRRDSQLITGAQFEADAGAFRHIEFRSSGVQEFRSSGANEIGANTIGANASERLNSGQAGVATVGAVASYSERLNNVVATVGAVASCDAIDIHFNTAAQPLFHKNFDLLIDALKEYDMLNYRLFVLADSGKQIERLRDIFAVKCESLQFEGIERTLHEGFVDHTLHICLFTDHQIFDRFHKYSLKSDKARGGKVALTLKELQQFELGDYVVHLDHGIGRFGGLVRMPISGSQQGEGFQEMIKIIYQRGDAIYVSIHSLYKVSKYKSQEGTQPRISTLGTGQWERMKERTKNHIKDIARDLIRLYASRRHQRGFAYSHDSYMQNELEASFLYEDTPDQLKATQDVKADMERPVPMDRLVCGDVGFGKTEVAVRAAFKAACDSKQTAVLVPTTVLAYQHYRTFSSRLKDMPVRVDYLTRARTAKQTSELLKDLASGRIDILIGTHKLIGKGVKFKDLGLLIIDEEQKFGVSTKEKLRQIKTNIDTLTMSATPIPRTLQFSLVGARDLSVIQTPPPNRYPIQTEVHTFSADIIVEAINFEMSRNGQVFFVNNRISELPHLRETILKYIPDCRVAVGHGQMSPSELEKIVLDFSNYDYDVLLSTTIVENGIDIPNANTIIINGANNFGLSDLHQMRGRVGRGNRKAFCYLLAPPLSALPQDARRRLEALENFSGLGSGINIAMQDLDIRGAGNLLGAEQSGFISDLGYETYQKILNEAMAELNNESSPTPNPSHGGEGSNYLTSGKGAASLSTPLPSEGGAGGGALVFVSDCVFESDLEMYFPDQYVPSDSERLLLYRELDNTRDDQELAAYRSRLEDRFGPLPRPAEELLYVVPLRRMGKHLGCERIMLKQGKLFLYFVSNANSPFYQSDVFGRIIDFATQNMRRCALREQKGRRSMVIEQVPTVEEAVRVLSNI